MTIGYDPPRRGQVILMAVHLDKAHEYVKVAVHEVGLSKGPNREAA